MYGLPITVFHVLDANAATMRGKVVSLLPILDAKGAAMDRSETVTLFNDMVVLAPAALVDAPVVWTEDSPSRVRATYTRAAETVNADLIFDSSGDLVDLVSHDRSRASSDGTSFTLQPWNTPITDIGEFHGQRVAVEGTAMWEAPAPEVTSRTSSSTSTTWPTTSPPPPVPASDDPRAQRIWLVVHEGAGSGHRRRLGPGDRQGRACPRSLPR